ncbi:MAG: O-antigen ligase family protein [bacterium]
MNPAAPYLPKTLQHDFFSGMVLLLFSGVFFSVLAVADDLHDPTRTGKIFFFARWMLLVIPVGLIVFIRTMKEPVDLLSILVLLWGGWIILRGKTGGIWHDEKFFWFAGCFVFFFLTAPLLAESIRKNRFNLLIIPALVITVVAAAEAVLGLLQLYGGFRVYHGVFTVTGTYFNPAPYAGFLVASFPWALLLFHQKRAEKLNEKNTIHAGGVLPSRGARGVSEGKPDFKQRTISILTHLKNQNLARQISYRIGFISLLLIIVIIPSTRSRAAYLGLAAAVLVWVFYRYKPLLHLKRILNTKLKRRLAFTAVPVAIIILLTGLYLFKKDSADGRLLIWKVAWQTIKDKPLTGHGFNTAQATLAPAQAAWFAAGNGSESEKMLAGSVRWAFNEPLQTASETGLIGMFLLLLVTGYALFYKILKLISHTQYLHIGAARASLAGIVVFGCFSYPFYSLPVTLLFFYALAVLAAINAGIVPRQSGLVATAVKIPVVTAALVLAGFYLIQTPKHKKAYWLWDEANALYQINAYDAAAESFTKAYPVLQHNGLFLQQYAKNLAMQNRHKEALALLQEAENYYKDEFSFIALGDAYKALNQPRQAETHYHLAANMVPHKFYPLYLLANLYHETGQNEKAVVLARQLLNKEVKVASKAIEEIKEEMQTIVNSVSTENNKCIKTEKGKYYTKNSPILIKQQFW